MSTKVQVGNPGSIVKLQKINGFDIFNIIFLAVYGILIFYPFYNSVLVSFTPQATYVRNPFMLLPQDPNIDSYRVVFSFRTIFTGYRTTIIITLIGVAYNILLTVSAAFFFNKNFLLKKFFLIMIYFTLFFSGGLIPYYLLVRDLGLINNIFAMILPSGMNIMFMVVMRKYFAALPAELEESAKLDGAGDLQILFRIILPLAVPMLVTFILFYGVDRWNEWWNSMLFIREASRQSLQHVLRGIIQASGAEMSSSIEEAGIIPYVDGVRMAAVIVTMVPIMTVYPFLQKYFVQGLAIGAVKG